VVNDLKQLLRDNVADAPADHLDVAALIGTGRRRVRRRRTVVGGGTALLVAGAVTIAAVGGVPTGKGDGAEPATQMPRPYGPTLGLGDAQPAVEGRDYEVLASHTNRNLDLDNGQYFDGVTDDGLILFQDGPRDGTDWRQRFALLDPATNEKDWLPESGLGQDNIRPLSLGADRLVLLSDNGTARRWTAYVFDRETRTWSTTDWSGLPAGAEPDGAEVGPDGRLYLRVPATRGAIPEGGWPTGPDGEAEDADADGDTYHLWSVALTDGSDVRDEGLTVGDVAFTDSAMVWTDSTNGAAGQVHVRDRATGEVHSFDPHLGERCNLLGFGTAGDDIVMSQYCGTYGKIRDDRVQVVTTDGEQVVTIQDDGIDGGVASGDLIALTAFQGTDDDRSGTYVYDLASSRFLRVSDSVSNFGTGGPAPDGDFFWHTPVNDRHGATWWLGRLLD
jgi:hypothetical protein